MANLRSEVLACFRRLHKTRLNVFRDDEHALREARKRINDEFRKSMQERDTTIIRERINFGNEAEEVLRTTVIQARLNKSGNYEIKPTKDTHLLDNVPLKNK